MLGNVAKDTAECSNTKGRMGRYCDAMRTGLGRLQNNMAAYLIYLDVLPTAAEMVH
jgi:hypothetical protein